MTSTESQARSRTRICLEAALWIGGLVLVGAAFAVRLEAHAGYLHDHESLLVPTSGRELLHGHASQFRWFQGNVYQGSSLLDAFLAAAGFAVFGDGLLAWKWYGIAYAVGIGGAGAVVATKVSGRAGGAAFLLLLAAAPFLIKDSFLTPVGGHSSAFFFALAALAVAVAGKVPPSFARGLCAGIVLGVGAWYTRTTVSAGPAVLIALLPGGRRAVGGFMLGVVAFPALCAINALVLTLGEGPLASRGFGLVLRETVAAIRAEHAAPDYAAKLHEGIGGSVQHFLFAQPGGPGTGHRGAWLLWAGRVWWLTWMVGLGSLGALLLGFLKKGTRSSAWSAAVLLALMGGYLATYVTAPFRIDPVLLREVTDLRWTMAPGIHAPRYIVPIQLALTLCVAGAAGLFWRWRPSRLLLLGLLWPLVAGGRMAGLDALEHGEPEDVWGELRPFSYAKFYGPGVGRGPTPYWHARCGHPDPVSRANHRRAAGSAWAGDAQRIIEEPDYLSRRLEEYAAQWGRPLQTDLPFLVQGMGHALGDAPHSSAELPLETVVGGLFRNAESLGPELGEVFLQGVAESLPFDAFSDSASSRVRLLCRSTSWRTMPLCGVVGQMFVDSESGQVTTPSALFGRGFHPTLLDGPHATAVVEGAAFAMRGGAPDTVWTEASLAAWPDGLGAAFQRGWAVADARARWRTGDPWDPRLVP